MLNEIFKFFVNIIGTDLNISNISQAGSCNFFRFFLKKNSVQGSEIYHYVCKNQYTLAMICDFPWLYHRIDQKLEETHSKNVD